MNDGPEDVQDLEDDIPLIILAALPSPTTVDYLSGDPENAVGEDIPPESVNVRLKDSNGKIVTMLKTSLCWLLSTEGHYISSDRLQRVQADLSGKKTPMPQSVKKIEISSYVTCGDFCIFRYTPLHGVRAR